MSYKYFTKTYDNDQVRVIFEHEEEKAAFEDVLFKLTRRIHQNTVREDKIEDFEFDTTLEMEVAAEYTDIIRKIKGLRVFNVLAKNNTVIIPEPFNGRVF